jgi:hypothetical protein
MLLPPTRLPVAQCYISKRVSNQIIRCFGTANMKCDLRISSRHPLHCDSRLFNGSLFNHVPPHIVVLFATDPTGMYQCMNTV